MMQLSKVQNHFNRYLLVGGFPELALSDNDIMAQQIMREYVVDKNYIKCVETEAKPI